MIGKALVIFRGKRPPTGRSSAGCRRASAVFSCSVFSCSSHLVILAKDIRTRSKRSRWRLKIGHFAGQPFAGTLARTCLGITRRNFHRELAASTQFGLVDSSLVLVAQSPAPPLPRTVCAKVRAKVQTANCPISSADLSPQERSRVARASEQLGRGLAVRAVLRTKVRAPIRKRRNGQG